MVSDRRRQIAARIAQKLRDAGMGVEIFAPPAHIPSERLFRLDRIVTVLALALLTALA